MGTASGPWREIGAFCLTEPNAGSDASGIEGTAVSDGDAYVVNANKVFVTNGGVADICLLFLKTNPSADPREISVVVAERGNPGVCGGGPGRPVRYAGKPGQFHTAL